jgi:hypothetical protein
MFAFSGGLVSGFIRKLTQMGADFFGRVSPRTARRERPHTEVWGHEREAGVPASLHLNVER